MATLNSGLGGPAGFGETVFSSATLVAGNLDDGSVQVDITPAFGGSGINFFGTTYTEIYVNSNGLITFEGPETSYSPSGIAGLSDPAIAPFWSDIDISKGGEIYIDVDSSTSKITITWLDVEAFKNTENPGENSFQIVLSSLGSGDFDIEYIYEDIQWANGGFGSAEAGITDGGSIDFELPGSGDDAELANYDSADFGGDEGAGAFSLNVSGGQPDIPIGRVDGTGNDDIIDLGFTDNESEQVTTGDDIIKAGAGNDSIDGDEGSDVIYGGAGNDTIASGASNNTITPTTVSNGANLTGTSGQDVFSWTANTNDNATIRFNASAGSSDGDGIADFVVVETTNQTGTLTIGDFDMGTDKIVLQENFASIVQNTNSGVSNVTITYANGNQQSFQLFHGSGSFDSAVVFTTTPPAGIGTSDDDIIYGGDGADSFVMEDEFGSDTIYGGAGNDDTDTVDLSGLSNGVTVTFTGSEDGTFTDGADTAIFDNVEAFEGTSSADIFDADADSSGIQITARGGADSIVGGSDADTLYAGNGTDDVDAGGGNDTVYGGNGVDTLFGDFGDDVLYGGGGADILIDNDLSTSRDDLFGGDGDDSLLAGSGSNTLDGGADDDTLDAGDHDDFLFGGTGNDSLDGSGGNDLLYGGTGTDTIEGGGTGSADDTLYGGAGNDVLTDEGNSTSDDTFFGGAGDDLVYAGQGDDTAQGGDGSDLIYGGDGADSLTTGTGEDTIYGGAGDDNIANSSGNDTLFGGSGNDTLSATLGDDQLYGGGGNDSLDGGADDDRLYGDGGQDELTGGAGNDTVYGGDDQDTIFFEDGFGTDTIYGGEGGTDNDTLDLSALGAGVTVTFTGDEQGTFTDGTDTGTFREIEAIILTDFHDEVGRLGSDGDRRIFAGDGNDEIVGGTDDETVYGGAGDDAMFGGTNGNETFYGGSGEDLLSSGGTDNGSLERSPI